MSARRVAAWLPMLTIVVVSQFAQWYRQTPRAMLDAEQLNLWSATDFVLSFVYRLDEPGMPVRPAVQRLCGGAVPPLQLQSPHDAAPYVPAKSLVMLSDSTRERFKPYAPFYPVDRISSIRLFDMLVPRPLGANFGVPIPGRTFRGLPKTWHNIGIQCNSGTTPAYLLSGVLTVFFGRGLTNFSAELADPVILSRIPNLLFGTGTAIVVWSFARFITGSTAIGLAAGLFQALEPMSLAESRTNKTDTSVAFFVLLSITLYAVCVELRKSRSRRWVGVVYGLALLSKVQALLVPFVLLGWNACRRWFPRSFAGLRVLRIAALFGLAGAVAVWVAVVPIWRTLPAELTARVGGDLGFRVVVIGSLGFIMLLCAAVLWPLRRTADAVTMVAGWLRAFRRRGARADARWVPFDRHDVWLVTIALVVFIIGLPNIWGDPLGGVLHAWGRVGRIDPFRAWFFVTPTVYVPLYFYLLMVPLHAHPLYLAACLTGIVVSVRLLRHEPLERSRRARGLLLVLGWLIGYTLMTGVGGAYKKMQIAVSFYPWLSILAGIGLVTALRWLLPRVGVRRLSERAVGGWSAAAILACMLPTVWTHWPYYYLYVNPLFGDPNRLSRIEWLVADSVNGYERVADYLASIGEPHATVAAVGTPYNLAFVHPNTRYGDVMRPEDLAPSGCDYVAIHISEMQRSPHLPLIRYFSSRTPVHVVTINGIDVIWIYRAGA